MSELNEAKETVRSLIAQFDCAATPGDMIGAIVAHASPDYHWRGVHPFHEQENAESAVDVFWAPFRKSFTASQRRMDIFFAGANHCESSASYWVVNVGNFMGLFDHDWLGIRPTGKIAMLRYAEFHEVRDGKIAQTAFFCDILSIMHQAGVYPLPPMTGAPFVYPGPRTHDGLLFETSDATESEKTLALVNRMIEDLSTLNTNNADRCPPELLARTWADDMIWYGPYGIGASMTISRYQVQHQYPFRDNLTDKTFNGHVARIAEGNYCGFFGWPNLNNRNKGGFLGLPASDVHAPMRVVDIYRREGDKLAENWVYIDMLHYLKAQGLDVLERTRQSAYR